ncbi:hypothetical protein GGX14DRAFT_664171 [Mycena pura]|uniref:Protein kinase domain-containing protein n=1 Tax=Mycena pura TaxID=153505 RepID=A0AAD7E141_9AGAR|nr:hypothetical protein GGX14DRAFT_664171 [Mycena pura]
MTECKSPSDPSTNRYSTRRATVDSTAVSDRKRKRTEAHAIANKRLKFNESEKPRDNNPVQCASYALEMMSCGGFRSHTIGALSTNSLLELVYYDHSSVIVMSRAINFKNDRHRFIQFLHAFVSGASDSVWGHSPILKEPRTRDQSRRVTELEQLGRAVGIETFEGFTLKLQDGRTLTPGTTVYQTHVKLSHFPKIRTLASESEIINAIQDASGRAGPRPGPDGLPKVFHAEEHGYGLDTTQGRLAEFFQDNMYELRDLCILVQEELQPITSLTTADELAPAFRDIFAAYRWLYEDVGIMHRDISINNLMVRCKNGRRYGVLNDFDLAIEMNKDLFPTSKQRTGTKPFMARDLLYV